MSLTMQVSDMVRFVVATAAAAVVGSGLATALLFTPVMEWVGSNSSALDMFTPRHPEAGLWFGLMRWGDFLGPTLLEMVVVWTPTYFALARTRRAQPANLLLSGAAFGLVTGIVLLATFVFPVLGGGSWVVPAFTTYGWRAAIVGAGLGLATVGAFRLIVGPAATARVATA
jgi:hypothetical protein